MYYKPFINKPITALSLLNFIIDSFITGKKDNKTKDEIVNQTIEKLKQRKIYNDMNDMTYTPWNVNYEAFVKNVASLLFDNDLSFLKQNLVKFFRQEYFDKELVSDIRKEIEKNKSFYDVDENFYKIVDISDADIIKDLIADSKIIAQKHDNEIKNAKQNIMSRIINSNSIESKFAITDENKMIKAINNAISKIIKNISENKTNVNDVDIAVKYNSFLIESIVDLFYHSFSIKQLNYLEHHNFNINSVFKNVVENFKQTNTNDLAFFVNKKINNL